MVLRLYLDFGLIASNIGARVPQILPMNKQSIWCTCVPILLLHAPHSMCTLLKWRPGRHHVHMANNGPVHRLCVLFLT
jgi:hypothetical protein